MSVLTVIGVDPGVTTGIAWLRYDEGLLCAKPMLIQCSQGAVTFIVGSLIGRYQLDDAWEYREPAEGDRTVLAYEKFVVRYRAGRVSDAKASELTRNLIGWLEGLETSRAKPVITGRSAAEVKPWATDNRLNALGLGLSAGGMSHARDACRHALFAAVRDHNIPDPLSRKAK